MPETASHCTARPPRPPARASPMNFEDGTVQSQFSVTPTGTPFISEQDGDFELMSVKVTVLGLSGIIRETAMPKKKTLLSPSNSRSVASPMPSTHSPSVCEKSTRTQKSEKSQKNAHGSTISSLSSTEASTDIENLVNDQIPTVAIVAFQRNVTNSQTVIATHLPSHPLGLPVSSVGPHHRYVANWPTESHSFAEQMGEGEVDRASFTLLRVMMKDPYVTEASKETVGGTSKASSRAYYTTETIDIHIGLGRGKDIIPLGLASLVITGEEEGAEMMVLPAKPMPSKGKMVLGGAAGSKKRRNKLFKSGKKASFPGDNTSTYKLDEDASLRVMVKVLPNYAADGSKWEDEAFNTMKEKKEQEERPKLQVEVETPKQEFGVLPMQLIGGNSIGAAMGASITGIGTNIPTMGGTVQQPGNSDETVQYSLGRSIFCGCSPLPEGESEKTEEPEPEERQPKEIIQTVSTADSSLDNTQMDSYGPKFGTSFNSSEMSSVSESESFSDDETENEQIHLNRKIFVRKKLSFGRPNNREIRAARATLRKQAQRLGVHPKDLI